MKMTHPKLTNALLGIIIGELLAIAMAIKP